MSIAFKIPIDPTHHKVGDIVKILNNSVSLKIVKVYKETGWRLFLGTFFPSFLFVGIKVKEI